MSYQKVYLRKDRTFLIRCPVCMAEKIIPQGKLPNKHKFSVKCPCGSKFNVQIELRNSFRKDVNFNCRILLLNQNARWGRTLAESHDTKIKPINCRIANLSLGGVGLHIDSHIKLHENDEIIVKFNLDNSASTEIEKQAVVKRVKDDYLGCKFLESDHNDKDLKFYFL